MAGVYEAVDRFLAGLVAAGVEHVIVSPGMRSTPLTLSAHRRSDLTTRVVLDERSAGFVALGIGRATDRPAALICTSGTAGANYYPAVIEAGLSRVPLVVVTADRPPELHGWDAGQTIDQTRLFGTHVRDFVQLPVGEMDGARAERIGARAATTARSIPAGPVHVNWPFREPLEPPADWHPPAQPVVRSEPRTWGVRDAWVARLAELAVRPRGLIVAGPRLASRERAGIIEFALASGWPILADPLSGLRHADTPEAIAFGEYLLRVPAFADTHVPDVIVRVGDSPTSKAYRLWSERHAIEAMVLLDPEDRWADATAGFTDRIPAPPGAVLGRAAAGLEVSRDRSWLAAWQAADRAAGAVLDRVIAAGALGEAAVTRAILARLGDGARLHLASSMPVRDADLFMPAMHTGIDATSSRGANGIDGTLSTATGLAIGSGSPVTAMVGDLAFLHDIGGLVTAVRSGADLTVVVIDNGGGGIFSLLPIADAAPDFDRLYRTPHDVDVEAACAMAGATYIACDTAGAIEQALRSAGGGVTVVHVPVDHDANVAQMRAIAAEIAAALGS